MGSSDESAESRIMEAAIPYIRQICFRKWYNLEYQDRVSEACRIFIEDLRSLPLNTGHFLEDYRADMEEKMREINKRTPSLRYGHCSLDAVFSGKTHEFIDGYRFVSSPLTDFSVIFVADFLARLPLRNRRILACLLKGFKTAEISEMLGISVAVFNREMGKIRQFYRKWNE